jgi:hypothetical protein
MWEGNGEMDEEMDKRDEIDQQRDGTIKYETSAVVDVTSHSHKALALTVRQ